MKRGETCVIMGRSGVGKSVSLKHIMGFLRADSGQVIRCRPGRDRLYRAAVLRSAQESHHGLSVRRAIRFADACGENIAFPHRGPAGRDRTTTSMGTREKLAKELEVEDVLDKVPSELSTGMKRAVAIARALAQNPEAILYDEPTTMVDPIMAVHMGDLILRLKEKFHRTSIVVTHDTHLARKLADTMVFLQEGQASVFSSWAEFENSPDPFFHNFLHAGQI